MTPPRASEAAAIPRRLVIVRQDNRSLYCYLSERLADVANVEVILDRRQGLIRGNAATGETGPSEPERRQPPGRRERDRWHSFGYRLADGVRGDADLSPGSGAALAAPAWRGGDTKT